MSSTTDSDTLHAAKLGLPIAKPHKDEEIRLYSLSDAFYRWPVWAHRAERRSV
jgi:hypothetical protein